VQPKLALVEIVTGRFGLEKPGAAAGDDNLPQGIVSENDQGLGKRRDFPRPAKKGGM